ncbi:MAG: FHA domain-containing protein [Chloroflexi bacterium]|nr:FHA domain-containing protein [Chloroflexota bacterium]
MQSHEPPEAYLIPIEDGREGPKRRLKVSTIIGRAPECDVALGSARVSRRHAEVFWDGERFLVKDLDSLNGTSLGGSHIRNEVPLTSGDTIELADCRLRFELAVGSQTEVFFVEASGLSVNVATHQVRVNGLPVKLTPKEFLLVALLHARSPDVVSYEEIAISVWPELEGQVHEDNVTQLVVRLRRELNVYSTGLIVNVRGFGYRLDDTSGESA